MTFRRGEVVLVNYPFASGRGAKTRPALVVQTDINNLRLDNTIIVQITSRTRFAATEPTQLLIQIASPAGAKTGLLHDSAVSCENIFTIRQDAIIRKLGVFSEELMARVNGCLESSLGIT